MVDYTPIILAELTRFAPVVVYQFGSTVKQTERPDSDLDLAFLASRPCDPYAVFTAAQRIAAAVGRDVDLVDLGRVGDVFKAQVIGTGRRLFTGNELAADTFEMLALSGYARLNEERREVLIKQGVA